MSMIANAAMTNLINKLVEDVTKDPRQIWTKESVIGFLESQLNWIKYE